MNNVVVLGGGSGLSTILKGMKEIPDIDISAIVSVSDDGGSTATVRQEFKLPAVGDLRRVIVALSNSEHILKKLMDHRFESSVKENAVFDNHSLGNLIITALVEISGGFYEGIQNISEILNVKGSIYPVASNPDISIKATYTDGTETVGEHHIPNINKTIKKISYINPDKIKTNPVVIEKIKKADYIVFSVGSLYTSIIPNLIAPGIKKAIIQNEKAKVIYVSNIMTQPGETHDMNLYQHIKAIEDHLEYGVIDYALVHKGKINDSIIKHYALENSHPVLINQEAYDSHVQIIEMPLINNNEKIYVRHDAKKILKAFCNIFERE
ncbi:gluconeogenesis factor YvcK family protein [[Mycoplasma] testudinis]|uniref:gluconeogenesis factor YvcK family protein n=1 Tax=[Mycoplasma] testudinis TaxID=33924 RepID=UPI000483CB5B|nr:gluconeogenesis factor YvcK family protein [[Mycoplasma] testudinis]